MSSRATVGILNYGAGNVAAFCNMCGRLGVEHKVINEEVQLRKHLGSLIMPGVGSFDGAMLSLKESGLFDALDNVVARHGMPIMGVCVGMQMFGEGSDEGQEVGLGWIKGRAKKINDLEPRMKSRTGPFRIPHMGWNSVDYRNSFASLASPTRNYFYFLHSFAFRPAEPATMVGSTNYFGEICSMVKHENIFGVQFHPEKSHVNGERLVQGYLKDFKC